MGQYNCSFSVQVKSGAENSSLALKFHVSLDVDVVDCIGIKVDIGIGIMDAFVWWDNNESLAKKIDPSSSFSAINKRFDFSPAGKTRFVSSFSLFPSQKNPLWNQI